MERLALGERDGGGRDTGECRSGNGIDGFVSSQVVDKGLDERTAKAYRQDLECLDVWIKEHGEGRSVDRAMEDYLKYLAAEKKLRYSTITRKYRVFSYYLEYLSRQGFVLDSRSLILPEAGEGERKEKQEVRTLSKGEVDAFFIALDREYGRLNTEFRRSVCLRDSVMMGLLFYLGIKVSELLRLEVSDYDCRTGVLTVRGKKGKSRGEYLYSHELRKKMGRWLEEHGCFERDGRYCNVLFLSKEGKPLSMKMIIKIFNKYRELAGIEKEATPKDWKKSMGMYAKELVAERCG